MRIILLLFLVVSRIFGQLDASLKNRILNQISSTLKTKAYTATTTFNDIDAVLLKHKQSIDSATSPEDFTNSISGVFRVYGVSHFSIMSPRENENKRNMKSIGLGALMRKTEKGYFISNLIQNGPAEKAGVQRGDYLLKVDNNPMSSGLDEAEEGMGKTLTLLRGKDTVNLKVNYFAHRPYSRDTLYSYNDSTLVIEVHSFTDPAYDLKKIEKYFIEAAGSKRLIIDIRGNRGGNSNNVAHLLSMLVPHGTVGSYLVHREDYDKFLKKKKREPEALAELAKFADRTFIINSSNKKQPLYKGKVFVFIDNNCGSGGELFPAIVQDLKLGIVIGYPTIGKVLSGKFQELEGGFLLQYPTGEMIRFDGSRIEGKGCIPDIQLNREETANDSVIFSRVK